MSDKNKHIHPSELPFAWLSDGRTPLVLIQGFADLYVNSHISLWNHQQISLMAKVLDQVGAVLTCWERVGKLFAVSDPQSEQPFRADELNKESILHLTRSIAAPAIKTILGIESKIDLLQSEKLGPISEEDHKNLTGMKNSCTDALGSWNQLVSYYVN